MIVCVCHNVTEQQIIDAVQNKTLHTIKMCNQCRVCTDTARDVVKKASTDVKYATHEQVVEATKEILVKYKQAFYRLKDM